jgi:phosphoglycolate phosphatase-like HAD superfamily hydrolase
MNSFPFDIIGFDPDGTLVDSALDLGPALNHAHQWRRALCHVGRFRL